MEGSSQPKLRNLTPIQARRSDFLEKVRRYATGPLIPLLGGVDKTIEVFPAVHGGLSLVYFIVVGTTPRAVLRAVPSFGQALKLAYNLPHLGALGLPVAKLLLADRSPLSKRRWGFYPIVEAHIEGNHVDASGPRESAVRAVARTLARFHAVERRNWGWPYFRRRGNYRRYYLSRVARRARNLDAALLNPRSSELIRWFGAHSADAPLDPPYSLIHARIQCENFIITPEGEAYAIDLLECRFGTFAADINSASERICRNDPVRIDWFLEEYFSYRPEHLRKAFERSSHFFKAGFYLSRSAITTRRIARASHSNEQPDKRLNSLRRYVRLLTEITGIDMEVSSL